MEVQADLTHRWCLDRRVVSASTLLCAATDGLFQAVCVVCVLRTQVVLPVSGVVLPTYGPAGTCMQRVLRNVGSYACAKTSSAQPIA
jgi:hypothetical protein